jgi:uroporphyrinogen decarboxylase
MENTLIYMRTDPGFLHTLMDRICEYNLKLVDIVSEYDIDGIHFGDDWGQQRGLIMGPGCWHEFVYPRLSRMYARAKERGLLVSSLRAETYPSFFQP